MADDSAAQIAALRALREATADPQQRAALDAAIAALERPASPAINFGTDNHINSLSIQGDVVGGSLVKTTEVSQSNTMTGGYVGSIIGKQSSLTAAGVNHGTIQLFFGAKPPADAKALLDSYLRGLVAEHGFLRLGKLLDRERSGRDQAVLPEISLLQVYTSLATDRVLSAEPFALDGKALIAAMQAADPAQLLPDRVRLPIFNRSDGKPLLELRPLTLGGRTIDLLWHAARRMRNEQDLTRDGHWYRPETLTQALGGAGPGGRVVLLGGPGSGKSTGLRHLAVYVATALLSGRKTLAIPFFCPLGPVAARLGADPAQDRDALIDALLAPALGAGGMRAGLREQLLAALAAGNAFLFFDGLDEVPGTPEQPGQPSRRERIADAIRALARQVGQARVVVTCRTRPYEQDAAWQLREGWAVRRLQPFAFGQIRHFIARWYAATCADGQGSYTHNQATARADRLVALLGRPERAILRELAATPLLLTMLVLLDYNNTQMPERRADVYEELVKLLLDRWEGVRSSDKDQRTVRIGERLGLSELRLTVEDLRPALHELAFTAHSQQVDGRGVLTGALLRETLDPFFARLIDPERPREAMAEAARPRERLRRLLLEESGLLLEEADETYVFPHLTFEEYLAACHLAGRDSRGMDLAYRQWAAGGERWREVVRLMLGRLQRQEKHDNLFGWLQRLVPRGQGAELSLQRQRDALLAADCYATIEGRRAFAATDYDLTGFEDDLRNTLLAVLARPDPALTVAERFEAGEALGELGDPRYPVDAAQWAAEIQRRNETFGRPAGYLCYVPGGRYQIGGWPGEDAAAEGVIGQIKGLAQRVIGGGGGATITLPPFWVARFPITVGQYAPFVAEGYGPGAERWWTKEGWAWREKDKRRAPPYWGRPGYDGVNQPVVTITWYEATAYCAWLTERLAGALPPGHVVRLPTEAEWEVAAAYDGAGQRHTYPWGEAEPTPELAIYNAAGVGRPAPVGCCPAGAAASGALDLAGNVWELAASVYEDYPSGSHQGRKELTKGLTPWRGGSWWNDSSSVRCGARVRRGVHYDANAYGFRCVVAPPLAQMS